MGRRKRYLSILFFVGHRQRLICVAVPIIFSDDYTDIERIFVESPVTRRFRAADDEGLSCTQFCLCRQLVQICCESRLKPNQLFMQHTKIILQLELFFFNTNCTKKNIFSFYSLSLVSNSNRYLLIKQIWLQLRERGAISQFHSYPKRTT